jgi:hypothetical protein
MNIAQDLFGVWTLSSAQRSSVDSSAVHALWRLELPTDHEAAMNALDIHAFTLLLDRDGILESAKRLYHFVDSWVFDQPTEAEARIETAGSPEYLLAEAIDSLRSTQARGIIRDIPDIVEEFQAFLSRVHAFLSNYAVIETASNGTLLARTCVSWSGDFTSWCREDLTADQALQHVYSMRVAIQRRRMLVQLLSVVIAAAADIGMRAGTPGGVLLALPAIWRFIRMVADEYRRAQAQGLGL